ncbi:MAG: polysaccharide deacetylase family protein [Acutalibacteraceae bacterium]
MKKLIAILLSFAIMISCVSGLAIQAETEDSCFTPDGITVGNTLSSIPTWMTFNVAYGDKATDGYIAKINSNYNTSASTGNIYIKLPSSIWDTSISKLDFSFKCTDGTWGTRGNYVYLAPSLSNFSSNGIAVKNWFSFGEAGTTLTIDLSLDTYANAVSGKYCYLILSNGGVANYYTGTEMLLTDVLVYSGEVIYPKATFKGASTGDFEITADSNFQVTLPTATVENGNFLGWTLDGNTLLKEGNTVALTKDLTYYAVSDVKAAQTTPDAPTLNSKTDSSVTLNAVTNCEYSIDGEIWQESTLFENLRASTEYTFYQRYKGNLLYDVSDKSIGLQVTTDSEQTVFEFEAENTYNSAVVGTVKTASYSDSGSSTNYTYVAHDESSINVDDSIEYTFSGLNPGSYLIDIYARCTATRSTYSLTAYDSSNDNQDLGSVNFADWYNQYRVSGYQYYCKSTLATKAIVSKGNSLTLKFTVSTAGSSGSCIDKFVLTKSDEEATVIIDGNEQVWNQNTYLTLPDDDNIVAYYDQDKNYYKPSSDILITGNKTLTSIRADLETSKGAQMRINSVNGLRFLSQISKEQIKTLEEAGFTIKAKGTLIARKNVVGRQDHLTFERRTFIGDDFDCIDIRYATDAFFNNGDDYIEIAGSIINIKEKNLNKEFFGRGYMIFTNGKFDKTIYASTVDDGARSICEVAKKAKADSSYYNALLDEEKEIIDNYASKYSVPTIKYVASTFDDGPDGLNTPPVLEVLEDLDMKATFFMIASNLDRYNSRSGATPAQNVEAGKMVVAAGHQVESHSYYHNYMTAEKYTPEVIKAEMQQADDTLKQYLGVETTHYFRPPAIMVNQTMYDSIDKIFICGIGNDDGGWATTKEHMIEGLLNNAADGVIFLQHDNHPSQPEVMKTVVPQLRDQGYVFVTLDELFAIKGVTPSLGKMYSTVSN